MKHKLRISNPVSNIDDANESTRWISDPKDNATISTDLGGSYALNKVSVLWAGNTIRTYDLQVSSDNASWTTIASGTTNNSTPQLTNTTSFSGTPTGRYFRIVARDRWNTSYGASSTNPTPPPPAPGTPGDVNGDGTVGAADMAILLSKWTW
ncbi:MAG TPA: discoidin domain-containing protein [Candidatus Saccharimonadales bacterium]|jgi:hypothetical protein